MRHSQKTNQKSKTDRSQSSIPPIVMTRDVRCQIMCTIATRRPEAGGILLGPIGSMDVTAYHFDSTATTSTSTYTPDHIALRRKMQELWIPSGIDMKGLVHSHPGRFDRLSGGDMIYIRRLLEKNPDLSFFIAPIVIPQEFRIQPIIVLADKPDIQCPTRLELF
jgi:hypothetical protein